jgi:hypothetical protein
VTRATRHASAIATVVALTLGALALPASEASAAPPIVCVRNLSGAELEVVTGVQEHLPDRQGLYWGKAQARGGACRYADIDGDMDVSFRRVVPADRFGEQYGMIPTVNGGWSVCPAQSSADGWYTYTVRRGRGGLTCRNGGGTKGLEGPGDYE